MEMSAKLPEQVRQGLAGSPSAPVSLLVKEILSVHGEQVQAVLFYGSCLHKGEDLDGLFDLYVLVNSYDSVNRNRLHSVLNRLLPPNVFYLEVPYGNQTIRAKYAILSLVDLDKGTSGKWFHSYLWARFCQPTAMVYGRNEKAIDQVTAACSQAVVTFITRVLPCLPKEFTIRELWSRGLELTYRSEIRPEQADKQVRLFDARPACFEDMTCKAFDSLPWQISRNDHRGVLSYTAEIPYPVRLFSPVSWAVRRVQGKILSALRLVKGTLTFEGGVDYILWKIRRHSGVSLEVGPFLRRHPVLAMCVLSLRLYRRGGIQ